ncbi:23S rRNA (adenine(1618)-N(6))-methyltransferase RlmF [Colwellia hornerae]|uniref:Ribosomal RNA large subunit methyltransferase F n=1 Tax=Colwellia hornerae TaxID=89402 RepID=A0A5C6QP71_9GAMM|nr:23S rRNA (adenine(1618)-N(6))-methyltransferase RlmF [Colwellia hornerae]TWX56270.1 23S rRNA (adenine(1618)-N(6))-methyltransferase RlmF [Colwellia hornerae]TWX62121.1 23S rRNA (adenine(1618)-N(6))-methyltransferase RlmF [Colwellia hornerae]TWX70523.1 23S rRNA (adenine(1618)-N(6))-methyltransferase RlmF [Colwellia hornerae]
MPLKQNLHPKNRHNNGYDFLALCQALPALKPFVHTNKYQNLSIDFADANAVKALNQALLKLHYQVGQWDIPAGYLCPPIPGRVDYIHYLADLLAATLPVALTVNKNKVSVLDIGTGASCIYALLGQREYQWQFTCSDIDPTSIKVAEQIISADKSFKKSITCRLQPNSSQIFTGIIEKDDRFELTLCNPPFHRSLAEATKGSTRKVKNLAANKKSLKSPLTTGNPVPLNFGGQKAELWCQGGELAFINQMIKESKTIQKQVLWFSCLVSKKDHISQLKQTLNKYKAKQVKVVDMAQGQKISRFIAWSFLDETQQRNWYDLV